MVTESSEDLLFGQTLKRTAVPNLPVEGIKDVRRDSSYNVEFISDNERYLASAFKDISFIRTLISFTVLWLNYFIKAYFVLVLVFINHVIQSFF